MYSVGDALHKNWEIFVRKEQMKEAFKMRDKILILGLSAALLMSLFCYIQEIAAGYDVLSERIPVVGDDASSLTSNVPPVVEVVPDVSSGKAPLRVQFEGDVYDEDGEITSLEWDFEGDGAFEVTSDLKSIERPQKLEAAREALQKEHVYERPGIYHAVVRVTDDKEESTIQQYPAIYGNVVVWKDDRNGNWDIYGYDLSTENEFQITEDVSDQEWPAIYGNTVVWKTTGMVMLIFIGMTFSLGRNFK
jgi:beta propeller repeat protein